MRLFGFCVSSANKSNVYPEADNDSSGQGAVAKAPTTFEQEAKGHLENLRLLRDRHLTREVACRIPVVGQIFLVLAKFFDWISGSKSRQSQLEKGITQLNSFVYRIKLEPKTEDSRKAAEYLLRNAFFLHDKRFKNIQKDLQGLAPVKNNQSVYKATRRDNIEGDAIAEAIRKVVGNDPEILPFYLTLKDCREQRSRQWQHENIWKSHGGVHRTKNPWKVTEMANLLKRLGENGVDTFFGYQVPETLVDDFDSLKKQIFNESVKQMKLRHEKLPDWAEYEQGENAQRLEKHIENALKGGSDASEFLYSRDVWRGAERHPIAAAKVILEIVNTVYLLENQFFTRSGNQREELDLAKESLLKTVILLKPQLRGKMANLHIIPKTAGIVAKAMQSSYCSQFRSVLDGLVLKLNALEAGEKTVSRENLVNKFLKKADQLFSETVTVENPLGDPQPGKAEAFFADWKCFENPPEDLRPYSSPPSSTIASPSLPSLSDSDSDASFSDSEVDDSEINRLFPPLNQQKRILSDERLQQLGPIGEQIRGILDGLNRPVPDYEY